MASPPGGVAYVCGEVVSLTLLSAVVTEAVAYIFIYRTSEYQRLSASVDKVSRIIEKKREAAPAEKQKAASKQKKIDRIEKSLGSAEKGLAFVKVALCSGIDPRIPCHACPFHTLLPLVSCIFVMLVCLDGIRIADEAAAPDDDDAYTHVHNNVPPLQRRGGSEAAVQHLDDFSSNAPQP
eukprot:6182258-Pleurochrysis_carterae.AAC.3